MPDHAPSGAGSFTESRLCDQARARRRRDEADAGAAGGVVPLPVDLPGAGPWLVDQGPRPGGAGDRRAHPRRPVRRAAPLFPRHPGPVDPPLPRRWVRRAGAVDPPARQPASTRTVLELAAALKRENPDRTAAQVVRILRASAGLGAVGIDAAAAVPPPRADGPGRRRPAGACSAGSRPRHRTNAGSVTRCTARSVGGRKTYLFAFLDDHSRLAVGYRFGFAEDTVRLAAALQPALAARGVPASVYVDNGSAFVDCLAAAGLRQARHPAGPLHPAPPSRPRQDRAVVSWRAASSSSSRSPTPPPNELAERGLSPAAALLELNGLFTAWVESGLPPPGAFRDRADTRWPVGTTAGRPVGHGPVMPSAQALTEAFLWSAAADRHQDRDGVAARQHLPGRTRPGRPQGRAGVLPVQPGTHRVRYRRALLRTGAAARASPATPTPKPAPRHPSRHRHRRTGIAYLHLVADAHHQQVAADERIGFHALYSTEQQSAPDSPQLPGQLSIGDAHASTTPSTTTPSTTTFPPVSRRGRPGMSIQRLQAHWGFTRMPFGRSLAPSMLHRHAGHGEAVARIGWCVDQHALGVITGEVGAGKTVAVRAATAALDTSRHVVIYLPNPSVGVRGMLHHIVAALGQVPSFYTATLAPQAADAVGRRTRRTRPHPRRRDRRGAPAGQPATGSDPHAHEPRHGLRCAVRRAADRSTHPAAPAPPRCPRRAGPTDLRPLRPGRDDRRGHRRTTSPTTSKSPAGPTPCSAPTPSP